MFLLYLLVFSFSKILKDRKLSISVDGNWEDTHLLAEAAAFIADVSGEAYWTFLRGLKKFSSLPNTSDKIRDYSLDYLSDEFRYLLELSLLTRSYSPRIEMFRKIAQNYNKSFGYNDQHFVVYGNNIFYTINDFKNALSQRQRSRPIVYPFEPRYGNDKDTIIVFAPITDPALFTYLDIFEEFQDKYSFVYRPIGTPNDFNKNKFVSFRGYGFEARPFNYSMTYQSKDQKNQELTIDHKLETPDSELITSKNIIPGGSNEWPNMSSLPTQLIQFCKTTSDPFATLLEVTQNFPIFAKNISKVPAVQSLTNKIMDKHERIIAGASSFYVNGRLVKNPDVYHILQTSLDQLRISQILREYFGLSKETLYKLLHLQPLSPFSNNKFVIDYRECSSFIYSLNDIETGKAYANWTTSLASLMTPFSATTPDGQRTIQKIKRNIYNAMFLIDPLDSSDMKTLLWMDEQVKLASVPFRFSYLVTPRNASRLGKRVINAWAHIRLKYSAEKAHQFLLNAKKLQLQSNENKMKETHYKSSYQQIVKQSSSPKWQLLDDMSSFSSSKSSSSGVKKKSREYMHLRKLKNHLETIGVTGPGLFFNGKYYPGKRNEKNLQTIFIESIPRLKRLYTQHKLDKNDKIETIDQILNEEEEDVYKRYNPLIQHKDKSPCEFINLIGQSFQFQKDFMQWSKTIHYNYSHINKGSTTSSKNNYDDSIMYSTFWVFVGENLSNSYESRYISSELESFIKTNPSNTRVAFFCDGGVNNRIVMNSMPPPFVQDLINLQPNEINIIFNGRVIRMTGQTIYTWNSEDFSLLLKWEYSKSISIVKTFIENNDISYSYEIFENIDLGSSFQAQNSDKTIDIINSDYYSQISLYLSFLYGYLNHHAIPRLPIDLDIFKDDSPVVYKFNINKNENNDKLDDSLLELSVILNPLDQIFQDIAPIIKFFRDTKIIAVNIYLNFDRERRDFPQNLKGFHRFLLEGNQHSNLLQFDRFDSNMVYSIIPHLPENWMIEPTNIPFDFDNFKASSLIPGEVYAKYQLSAILIEGSALDEKYLPVHSLRILLDMKEKGIFDSLSIKTLGYFQLQSQPGVWSIKLGDGSSKILYNILNTETITVSSFVPSWKTLHVFHNDGMSRYSSIYDLPKHVLNESSIKNNESNQIHVFVVISGELYEKLAKIMMISVMKNTKSHVKFWFLKNFISSQFRNDLQIMSHKYNFTYQFVQYHWPSFVKRQTERQRIIWGNKILFLDALFPMNLSRIIYIDADAVVRGDLIKLMKIDLKGKPYGFVPFGTSRKEMSKYHFWTKGYWKKRLGTTYKYHISAMFVVDLDRFRRMNAGDKLRKHYNKLADNSQSLANLDQDLPNDAQYMIPIHSLNKKWLWCCTWCSEYEKDNALIIDLANNPKTKMPKIEMAKKYIEEWPLLNEEAENFQNSTFYNYYNLTEIRSEHSKLIGIDDEENNDEL